MFCSRCGSPVPAAAAFCPRCGAPVAAPPEATAVPPAAAPPEWAAGAAPAGPPPGWAGAGPSVRYGGFWRRFWAWVVDGILLNAVFIPLSLMAGLPLLGWGDTEDLDPDRLFAFVGSFVAIGLVRTILSWLYFALMESSSKQATVGKMALGIRVTDLAGRRISFARATGRCFGAILSGLLFGIGFLMVAFTEKKQGLHDIMAGTLVVR
ncbi:MAG: RDD family protein [Candidatus Eisenbacteria bacterium]|nr:RDD family protein [Candidatus Eisenbacteria bacterium]